VAEYNRLNRTSAELVIVVSFWRRVEVSQVISRAVKASGRRHDTDAEQHAGICVDLAMALVTTERSVETAGLLIRHLLATHAQRSGCGNYK
jgi:hypothetical protein